MSGEPGGHGEKRKLSQQPGPYAGGLAVLVLGLFQALRGDMASIQHEQSSLKVAIHGLSLGADASARLTEKDVTRLNERLAAIESAVAGLPDLRAEVQQLKVAVQRMDR